MGLTVHHIRATATLTAEAALHEHTLQANRGMVIKEAHSSLSWLLEQVAVGSAQVIKLGAMQHDVLLIFYGSR